MKFRLVILLSFLIWVINIPSVSAWEQYGKAIKLYIPNSNLNEKYSCKTCHLDKEKNLNTFGEDVNNVLKSKNVTANTASSAIRWIELSDSDGDSYTNLSEIILNTNPGDPNDFPPLDSSEGQFKLTAPLSTPRYLHTVTVLQDGRVLAAGGSSPGYEILNSTELFNPETNTWSKSGSMNQKRWCHTATLLNDGRVLIMGGCDGIKKTDKVLATAEIYDPTTGKFTYTGSLNIARQYHSATLLKDGRVLIVGGGDSSSLEDTKGMDSAEIYDTKTGKFTLIGSFDTPRQYHRANLLNNGSVLITGGSLLSTTNSIPGSGIYNPENGKFTPVKPMARKRIVHTATLLLDGKVLIAGGSFPRFQDSDKSAELFDPEKGEFIPTGDMLYPMLDFDGTLLDDGKVLLAGGARQGPVFKAEAELYNPKTGKFNFTGPMSISRDVFNPVKLKDGRVLICGGVSTGYRFLSVSEAYVPNPLSQAEGIKRVGEFDSEGIKNIDEIISMILKKDYRKALEVVNEKLVKKIDNSEIIPKVNLLSETLTKFANGNKVPQIIVDAKPREGKIPLKVSFSSKATDPDGNVISYIWDFDNENTSLLQNLDYIFECEGNYNVKLKAIDSWGDSAEKNITIKAGKEKPGVSFKCDVMPILNKYCMGCHGASGGLSVISYSDLMKGGISGTPVVAGNPDDSLLIQFIVDPSLRMPPRGDAVPDEDLFVLKEWIKEGAKDN